MGNIFKSQPVNPYIPAENVPFNTIYVSSTASAKAPSLETLCPYCKKPTQPIDLMTKNHNSPIIKKNYCKPCGKTIDINLED
jgi:hypothetical protein